MENEISMIEFEIMIDGEVVGEIATSSPDTALEELGAILQEHCEG